ncbi:MAG: zf-HC2 domain-containing protein [Acidothermus sp.]|nr:zf-HC2 domain-containing protein [Acidothermus sp.]
MTPECPAIRLALGSYVLGALDPGERGRVDAHIASCADCRDELASLAALPGLLSRVSVAEVEAEPAAVDATLLPRILARVAAERRRARRRAWLVAAAVVAVLAAGSGLALSERSGESSAVTLTATSPVTGISASVAEWPRAWGTALEVRLTGETTGAYDGRCQLVVVGRDGRSEVAASWTATASGRIVASGATSLTPDEIAAFRVVRQDGTALVVVPAGNS